MSDPAPIHLATLWRETLERSPQSLAVIEAAGAKTWTRAQLQGEVEAWLAGPAAGLPLSRRRVGLAVSNGAGWFAAFLGLLQAGAVPVLLDASEGPERLAEQAAALGSVYLWAGAAFLTLPVKPRKTPEGLCLVKVTSGSTGSPKGLPFTHAQMAADGRQICEGMGIQETDTNFALIPLGHSYGLGNLVLPLLLQGSPVLCGSTPLPGCIAADCAFWKPTVFPTVPTLLRALLRSGLEAKTLSSLRLVISAGSPLAPEDACEFVSKFSVRVHSFYGSSETGGISYDRDGEAALTGRSVGTLLGGVSVRLARGGRFHVTSASVRGRGTFSPADRGCLSKVGELVLTGRVGRLFKIAGRRLDLAGLETEIATILGARGVLVTVHPERPEALAALISSRLSVREVRVRLSEKLAAWKVPARLRVVLELPATQRGKVDRKRAFELLAEVP